MTLQNGLYTIRYVPKGMHLPFAGGMYATGKAINSPVVAQAMNSTIPGEQTVKYIPHYLISDSHISHL